MAKHELAVIIVNYNVKAFLHFCLHSLYEATKEVDSQIIVVDNFSSDDSVEFIRDYHPEIELICSESNMGFAKASNLGLKNSNAEYVLFLNPDMMVSEDFYLICKNKWIETKNIGALGIKLIDGKGEYLPESKRGFPNPTNSFFKQTGLYKIFNKSAVLNGYYLGNLSEDEDQEVDVLTGAFLFTKSEIVKKQGGFDEVFFMYGEDIDLCYRLKNEGYKIIYEPNSSALHFKGESTSKSTYKYFNSFYGSMKLYVNKHFSSSGRWFFNALLTFGIFISAIVELLNKVWKESIRPLTDSLILFSGLYFISKLWAVYFHRNPDHFNSQQLIFNITLYAAIWIFSLIIHGHYRPGIKTRTTYLALFRGLLIVLGVYALLGESMRSSRAIILFGFALSLLTVPFTKWAFVTLILKERNRNIQVNKNSKLLTRALNKIGLIPTSSDDAGYRLYSLGSMPFSQVFSDIVSLKGTKHPYFWDENHGILIGSPHKKVQGMSLDSSQLYNINSPFAKFAKSGFDIIASILLIGLYPIAFFMASNKNHYRENLWKVITRKKTLISYADIVSKSKIDDNIPLIKSGYWPEKENESNEEQILRIKEYAYQYTVLNDLIILFGDFKNVLSYLTNNEDH